LLAVLIMSGFAHPAFIEPQARLPVSCSSHLNLGLERDKWKLG